MALSDACHYYGNSMTLLTERRAEVYGHFKLKQPVLIVNRNTVTFEFAIGFKSLNMVFDRK